MPICITCNTAVKNLYTTYSKADDRSLGKGVRLTQCPKCKRFADKYVEHDYVVLFIDLVLIKPQVYRHLLFNRLGRSDDKLDPSILRLGILLVLFDVYITWARIERSNTTTTSDLSSASSDFSNAYIITQYMFFLTLNVVATVAQHVTIRSLIRLLVKSSPRSQHKSSLSTTSNGNNSGTNQPTSARSSPVKPQPPTLPPHHHHTSSRSSLTRAASTQQPEDASTLAAPGNSAPIMANSNNSNSITTTTTTTTSTDAHTILPSITAVLSSSGPYTVGPGHASPSAISTALLVSSCTKLFPILLVIWPTSPLSQDSTGFQSATTSFAQRASSYIGWIVLLNNIEALLILLDCGYLISGFVAVAGIVSRWLVEGWLLSVVGLKRDGDGYGDGPVSDVLGAWAWINARVR